MGKKKTSTPSDSTKKVDLEDEIAADLEALDSDAARKTQIPPASIATPEQEVEEKESEEKSLADILDEEESDENEDLGEFSDTGMDEKSSPSSPAEVPETSPEKSQVSSITPPISQEPPAAPVITEDIAKSPTTTEVSPPPPIPSETTPTNPPSSAEPTAAEAAKEVLAEELEESMAEGAEIVTSNKMGDKTFRRNIVEAALFVAGRPISVEELNIKTELKKKELEDILKELILEYMERPTALEIIQIGDKYSLQIKPEFTQNVKKFASGGLIPEAVLKTLTIIALKQPVMKNTLIKIRGSTGYEHVKFLLDRGFIEQAKKGRSQELVTTELFADTFGLSRDPKMLKKQLIVQLGIKGPSEEGPAESEPPAGTPPE